MLLLPPPPTSNKRACHVFATGEARQTRRVKKQLPNAPASLASLALLALYPPSTPTFRCLIISPSNPTTPLLSPLVQHAQTSIRLAFCS